MNTHTPGPWNIFHNSQGETFVNASTEAGQYAVARIYSTLGHCEADAVLIENSPALLLAARSLISKINGLPHYSIADEYRRLVAVIAAIDGDPPYTTYCHICQRDTVHRDSDKDRYLGVCNECGDEHDILPF